MGTPAERDTDVGREAAPETQWHAGDIQSWIGLPAPDSRAFVTACSRAQAAADYPRSLAVQDQNAEAAA